MKKILSGIILALISNFAVFAQSSERVSALLESETATCAQSSYLAAVYAKLIDEQSTDLQAFEALKSNGYFSSDSEADSEVTLSELSFIYMKALNLKGGLFYTLFPSKRYSYKELKAKDVLPKESDPSMKVSGRDTIDIFNACLELTGETE
ncbi:hypothetical protein [Treponema sp.]|uniref:hypothetical protein n=1 Tax=Treponema sp. TaxID=166 RepID=UPI003890D4B6